MNPPHRYNTRLQKKVQERIQEILKQSKEVYEKRKKETEDYGCQMDYIFGLQQHLSKFANAITRKDRSNVILATFEYMIDNICHIGASPRLIDAVYEKIAEFRGIITEYRNENTQFEHVHEAIWFIQNDLTHREELDNTMHRIKQEREEFQRIYIKLEGVMNRLDSLLMSQYGSKNK